MILLSDDNEAEEIAEGRISDKLLVKMISTAEKYGLREICTEITLLVSLY